MLRSSRVNFDLNRATECSQFKASQDEELAHDERTTEFLVIREWWDISPENEFRVFVRNGQITAVSQYFHLCYYPELVASAEGQRNLREMISTFFCNVVQPVLPGGSGSLGKLKTDTFVIDLVLDLTGKKYSQQVSIIELNPFTPSTSGCLFDWTRDRDILEGQLHWSGTSCSDAPHSAESKVRSDFFLLRVVETPPEKDVLQYLVPAYRRIAEGWIQKAQNNHGL